MICLPPCTKNNITQIKVKLLDWLVGQCKLLLSKAGVQGWEECVLKCSVQDCHWAAGGICFCNLPHCYYILSLSLSVCLSLSLSLFLNPSICSCIPLFVWMGVSPQWSLGRWGHYQTLLCTAGGRCTPSLGGPTERTPACQCGDCRWTS